MTLTDVNPTTDTTGEGDTISTAPTLLLPLEEAIEAFSAVLPHAEKTRTGTAAIECVSVNGDRLVATDKYTVGAYWLSASASAPFLVVRDVAEYVAKIAVKGLRFGSWIGKTSEPSGGYTVRIAQDATIEAVSVEILWDSTVERSQVFDRATGQFPPVVRLIDDWKPAERVTPFALLPENVERVLGFAKKFSKISGDKVVVFTPGKSTNPNKPGVIRAEVGKLVALIQPHMGRN